MKKILVLLLATAMLFASISCSNGNGSDSSSGTGNEVENGGGSGSGTGDKENEAGGSGSGTGDKENEAGGSGSGSDVPSTSDCTETVSTLELSDGKWTVYAKEAADFMTMEVKLEATVTNGAYEFTSGKSSISMDMEKEYEESGMPEAAIENFKNMSDEEKNALLDDEMIPKGWKASWDGLTLKMEGPLSADELAGMKKNLDLDSLPDDAEIKTNADKTKYTINISFTGEEGTTTNMEVIAVKNN